MRFVLKVFMQECECNLAITRDCVVQDVCNVHFNISRFLHLHHILIAVSLKIHR